MSSQVLWYAARAGGIVAWALAAGSVLWGLALSTHVLGRRPRPAWLFDLHRFLGGSALIFTLIHVVAVVLDTYVNIGIVNVLVPFTGDWHRVAVAWGVVGLYLLAAVELTSLARTHLPKRLWRQVHAASFVLFAVSTIHALTAGTDALAPPFLAAVVSVTAAVVAMTALRIARLGTVGRAARRCSELHHRSDHFAGLQGVHRLVDLGEADPPADHPLQVEPAPPP